MTLFVAGLGTSSILAGAIMAVLWRSSGKRFDIDSVNHAVRKFSQCYFILFITYGIIRL